MSNLWKEVPEAEEFFKSVVKNIGDFKLFEGETFSEINSAILGTNSLDSQ